MKTGELDKAEHYIEQIKRLQPDSPAGFVLDGDLLSSRRQYAKAAEAYSDALKMAANSQVLLKRAAALVKSGSSDQAVDELREWLIQSPEDVNVRLSLAIILRESQKTTDAIVQYQEVLKHQEQNVIALNDLAWLYSENNELNKALGLAEKAHQIMPEQAGITGTLGWMRMQSGDVERGLALLEQAAQKANNDPDILYYYAFALHQSGKNEQSRNVVKSVLDTHKTFSTRNKAEQLLKILH
jgi:predicted Zn-dependent protease